MTYKIEFEVRDSELDSQGVVNNSNYYIYFEHTRHKFLKDIVKVNFNEMTKQNFLMFLVKSEIEFKKSLLPDQKFYVTCKAYYSSRLKICFEQEIRLLEDNILIAKSINIGVCIDGNSRKPLIPEIFKQYLENIIS